MTKPNQDVAAANHALNTILDCACGHVDEFGNYVYRKAPLLHMGPASARGHDGLIGWMADGFPVYGPSGDSARPPTDLDSCGGHNSDSGNGGHYHYHALPGASTCAEAGSPSALQLPRCLVGCVHDNTINSASLQSMSYAQCIQQPGLLAEQAYPFLERTIDLPTELGNCSSDFAQMHGPHVQGLSDVNNGLLSVLVGLSLLVLSMVMCVMFREDLDMCCAPAQSLVHRKDPPRRCRSRLCCRAELSAGGHCDLCITRCGLGCWAPRGSEHGEKSNAALSKSSLSKADGSLKSMSILASTLSFRRKMQMTLTHMDIEAQHNSESTYIDEIDEHIAEIDDEDGDSFVLQGMTSSLSTSKHSRAHIVPYVSNTTHSSEAALEAEHVSDYSAFQPDSKGRL